VILSDAAKVFPDTGFDVGTNPIDTVLGAEDYVQIDLGIVISPTVG
jgi:hypothetical protein